MIGFIEWLVQSPIFLVELLLSFLLSFFLSHCGVGTYCFHSLGMPLSVGEQDPLACHHPRRLRHQGPLPLTPFSPSSPLLS